jgi:hypothetical protein
MIDNGSLLIGAIFVLFSALERFNTPPTNRSSTTALRYYIAVFCYLLFGMMLYLVFVYSPFLLEELRADSTYAHFVKDLPVAPFAALLLTVLLPKVPVLAEADGWIRERLQEMGSIPHEARRLAAELRKSRFTVSPHLRGEVTVRLRNEGFRAEDLQFEEAPELNYLWTKASVLMTAIEEWESDRRFVAFLSRSASDFDEIKRSYRKLTPRVRNCLRLLHDVSQENGHGTGDGAVRQFQGDLVEQITEFLARLYSFISRGLLQCGTTSTMRTAKLVTLGFDAKDVTTTAPLNLDQLMIVFGVVGFIILSGSVFASPSAKDDISELIERAVFVSSLYCIAVVCAVYPKERWKFARRSPGRVRPVTFYFAAGALAAGISLLVNFGFQVVIHHSLDEGWHHFRFSYPWALSSLATAFMLAFMTDDQPGPPPLSRESLRWIEGLAGAGMLVLASLMIRAWLFQLVTGTNDPVAQEHLPPPLLPSLARACAIGFVISYLVPTWYREVPRESERESELPARAEPAGVG